MFKPKKAVQPSFLAQLTKNDKGLDAIPERIEDSTQHTNYVKPNVAQRDERAASKPNSFYGNRRARKGS